MSTYQPNIPTGTVNLDVDYQNIQGNFQQLDTSFGVDHVTFSNQTAQNGYHTDIHFNPVSTTTTNPPNNQPLSHSSTPPSLPPVTPGFGQLFTAQINDGLNLDEALYFLGGGDRLAQLTRNFLPVAASTGYTFIPGGLILIWGLTTGIPAPGNKSVTFPLIKMSPPISFPNACFNVLVTGIKTSGGGDGIFVNSVSQTGFVLRNTSSSLTSAYWLAIGN